NVLTYITLSDYNEINYSLSTLMICNDIEIFDTNKFFEDHSLDEILKLFYTEFKNYYILNNKYIVDDHNSRYIDIPIELLQLTDITTTNSAEYNVVVTKEFHVQYVGIND